MVKFRYILSVVLMLGAALTEASGFPGGIGTVWAAEDQMGAGEADGAQAQAGGAKGGQAQAEDAEGGQAQEVRAAENQPLNTRTIQYANLPDLVKAYSPQVQMERTLYESRLNRYESAREDIMETRRLLREEADDMEDGGDTDGAASYRAQAKVLEEAAKDMDKQIRSAKGSSSTMSLRRMEDTMIWTAQNLMGTYHSLRSEQQGAAAKAELMQSKYEKALHQVSLGTLSQADADEAGKSAQGAMDQVRSIQDNMERTRKELLMVTGFSVDSDVEIGPMPSPDPARMDAYTLEIDKWRALGNNYELRQQRSGSSGGTNKELHARQRSIHMGEETMYGQIDTLYQDVLANRTLWQSACTAQAAREAQWKAASGKMQLGMLSRQEYLEARTEYLEGTAAKAQADVGFQQAMDAYDWAVKGLMVEGD